MKKELDRLRQDIVVALKEEKWDEALSNLDEWCERIPDHARSWLNRGHCLYRLGRLNEAVASFDRCLVIDPSSTKATSWRKRALADLDHEHTMSKEDRRPGVRTVDEQPTPSAAIRSTTTQGAASPSYAALASPGSGTAWVAGTLVEGRYEVEEVVRGGMAVVAIAFDRELRRKVAVKTPLPSVLATADGRTRFQREAESWIALGVHPNICCAHYLLQIGGMPRLFIEYVDGGDLNEWLENNEPDLEQRLDAAIQVASGLDYTHRFLWTDDDGVERQGVIHRDIKPANVLMTADGVARVTDFGLVRAEVIEDSAQQDIRPKDEPGFPYTGRPDKSFASGTWQTVTVADGFVGTPPYMAPELWRQALRGTIGTDMYAYGCVLYEIFLGRRPYTLTDAEDQISTRETHLESLMRLHLEREPPDPLAFDSSFDPHLAALLRACIAKDAGDRPQSFGQLRGQLVDTYERLTGKAYPRPEPRRTQLLADSLNNRGVSFVTIGVADRARTSFREALNVDPRHLEATFNNGLLEWRSDGLTDAELDRRLTEAERLAGLGSRSALLRARLRLLLDDPLGALDSLGFLPPADRTSLAARRETGFALLARTRASSDQEGLEEARDVLASVLEESPSDISAVIGFAEACSLLGDEKTAHEALTAARALDSDLPRELADAAGSHLPGHRIDRLMTHQAPVTNVLALPEGRTAARTSDGVAVIWEPFGYQPLHRIDLGGAARHGRSLAAAGDVLVACLENAPLTLFDLANGRRLRSLRPHPGVATCIEVSPDGRMVASGGSDRCLRLWNLETGECERTLQGHTAFISGVAWHPSEPWLVTSSADGTLMVWDVDQGRCARVLEGHRGSVRDLVLVGDRNLVISAGEDGAVGIWDLVSGKNVRFLHGHRGAVTAVALAGDAVAAGGSDYTIRIWTLVGGELLRVIRLPTPILDLSTTADDQRLLAAFGSSVGRLVLSKPLASKLPLVLAETAASGELVGRETKFREHLGAAREHIEAGRMEEAIAPLREARAVEGYDLQREGLELWSRVLAFFPKLASRSVIELRRFGSANDIFGACLLTPDGARGVAGGVDGSLRLFDCATGEEESVIEAHELAVTSVALSDCGRFLASGGRDGAVCVWDATDGECLHNFEGHKGAVQAVVFAHDDRAVISAGDDGMVRRWPLDPNVLPELLSRSNEAVLALAASIDQHFVVSGGWDSVITVSSLYHRAELRRMKGHNGPVHSVAVSPDCRVVASAGEDGSIRLWDYETGSCWRALSGHKGAVISLAFTPDARFVLSAGKDSTLRLWDTSTGKAERVIEGHAGPVTDVALSSDGSAAVSSGTDGSVRLWFLDWEPGIPDGVRWDDRVRPFLEVFLRRREMANPDAGVPTWTARLFRELVDDLARRGFGWIEPARVATELRELARNRVKSRTEERERAQKLVRQRQRQVRVAPARRLAQSEAVKTGLKRAGALAVVILGVLGLVRLFSSTRDRADFHPELKQRMTTIVREHGDRLHRGAAVAYHNRPTVGDAGCSENRVSQYVDLVFNAEQKFSPPLQPALAARDVDFRRRYSNAVKCLGTVGELSLVSQILQRVDDEIHPYRVEDMVSILIRIGAARDPRLVEALGDPSEHTRHLAALTLMYGRQPDAIETLIDALDSDDPRLEEGASYVLTELICVGALGESSVFGTVRRFFDNADPAVRLNAIRALILFESSGSAEAMLQEAIEDSDRDVAATAERTRKSLRSLEIDTIFK